MDFRRFVSRAIGFLAGTARKLENCVSLGQGYFCGPTSTNALVMERDGTIAQHLWLLVCAVSLHLVAFSLLWIYMCSTVFFSFSRAKMLISRCFNLAICFFIGKKKQKKLYELVVDKTATYLSPLNRTQAKRATIVEAVHHTSRVPMHEF